LLVTALSPDDDRFHPIVDPAPLWTETTWWGFHADDGAVGGIVYAFFRPNLGVATLVVSVWDADHIEPWLVPYSRSQWHLPMPAGDLDDLRLGPLTLRSEQPFTRYHLTYDDPGALTFDLHYDGVMAPHVVAVRPGLGHFDQLGRVTGTVRVGARELVVDGLSMRDRSWYVRDDLRSSVAGYTWGAVDEREHFLAFSRPGDGGAINGGYLVRDGVQAPLVRGTRRVVGRRRGHPDVVEVDAVDDRDRTLTARGTVASALASQSTPGMFAWMSVVRWDVDGRAGVGEDHDVFSPDHLAAGALR
jgi:hypothetical protein